MAIVGLTIAMLLVFFIMRGVGMRKMWDIFYIKMFTRQKGEGFARVYYNTGNPQLIRVNFNSEFIYPFGQDDGKESSGAYKVMSHCIYRGEYDIPTCDYLYDDTMPINPKTKLQTNLHPKIINNVISKAVRAQNPFSGDFITFLKKHWLKIGVLILGPAAILGFMNLQQTETIANLAMQCSQTVVQNATSLGK